MGKTNHSRAQEVALIGFVVVCFVLVAATLMIAFDESHAGATTGETYGYPAYTRGQLTATPSPFPQTPPPTLDPRTKQPTLTF